MQNKIETFCFSQSLAFIKTGRKLSRKGWAGKKFIKIQNPDKNSFMTEPYIYMEVVKTIAKVGPIEFGELSRTPWLASQADLLTDDWFLVD